MKYLQKHDLIKEVPETNARYLPCELVPLEDLCNIIDDQFEKILVRLGIAKSEVKFIDEDSELQL